MGLVYMHFGIVAINAYSTTFHLTLANEAEKAGWEGYFLWDHLIFNWDPWVMLAAVASTTGNLRVGTLVTPLARRRPQVVALQALTLDHLSGGRAVLGVGLGAQEIEFTGYGEEGDKKERAEKLDEALEVITKLWAGRKVVHHGKHYTVDEMGLKLQPVQRPRIPIWVGGNSKAALRRASKYDAWCPDCYSPSLSKLPNVPRGLTVEELPESIAYLRSQRRVKTPIDVVCDLETVDNGLENRQLIERLQQAGVTWVLESIHGLRYSEEDDAVRRIRMGPPAP